MLLCCCDCAADCAAAAVTVIKQEGVDAATPALAAIEQEGGDTATPAPKLESAEEAAARQKEDMDRQQKAQREQYRKARAEGEHAKGNAVKVSRSTEEGLRRTAFDTHLQAALFNYHSGRQVTRSGLC